MTEPFPLARIRPVVPGWMLREARPDLVTLVRAHRAGERPSCSCRPIRYGDLSVIIGYHDRCAEHAAEAPSDRLALLVAWTRHLAGLQVGATPDGS